ncbi:MAG: hypothetical protein PHQ75_09150 [Thermoguttaceae bacterium]|nr:hypothetical protein [Thermoguttaceae bacterium]
MKKLLHIATTDNGTELNIGRDGDDIGIMIVIPSETKPFVLPKELEELFGKEAVEKAKQALDYLRFKYGKDDGKELFESIAPDMMKVINEILPKDIDQ